MDGLQVIKRFIMHVKKTAFVVEHDFIMAAYLADRVIVYEGVPSKSATARKPQSLLTGLYCGLLLGVLFSFARDLVRHRPLSDLAPSHGCLPGRWECAQRAHLIISLPSRLSLCSQVKE